MFTFARANLTGLAAAALVVLALAGCSPSTPASAPAAVRSSTQATTTPTATSTPAGQSVAAACAELAPVMTTVSQDLSSSYATLLSNPAAAQKKLAAITDQLSAATAKVTNPAVKTTADAAVASLVSFNASVTAALTYPKTANVAALQKDATAVQATFVALGKACTA